MIIRLRVRTGLAGQVCLDVGIGKSKGYKVENIQELYVFICSLNIGQCYFKCLSRTHIFVLKWSATNKK